MPSSLVTCATLQDVTWLPGAACQYDHNLLVCRFQLAGSALSVSYLRSLLRPDELSRARRYRQKSDQLRSICTRGLLRVLAGSYTQQDPRAIQFVTEINKKPAIKNAVGIHINAAHSGDWILLAIGRVRVGIDVEVVNPDFAFANLLPHSFSADEQQYILTTDDVEPGPARHFHAGPIQAGPIQAGRSFYQLWTRKEALVKATGKGMDDDFYRIPSLDGEHRVPDGLLGQAGNWTVRSLPLTSDYAAAVAYEATGEPPRFYTIDSVLDLAD